MTPADLSMLVFELMLQLAKKHGEDGLNLSSSEIIFERPKNRQHGDWSTNIALQVSSRLGIAARNLAADVVEGLSNDPRISSAEVAGPGFVNIRLKPASAASIIRVIASQKELFGEGDDLRGQKINLEFVSANPTGPVHLGGTRWAAVGDSLARILKARGASVVREYYFNDQGNQIDTFAKSLHFSYLGKPLPEGGYGGAYISEIAKRVATSLGDDLETMNQLEQLEAFRGLGVELMFQDIKHTLSSFGVQFDVYFHEQSLFATGAVSAALEELSSKGHIEEREGAVWLTSSKFGDDKDRVIIKRDGSPAYFAGDIAYYRNKRERGFDRNIMILGADHHGYVKRMMAMCSAFGDEPGFNLEILIGQLVNLVSDGVPVRMSKRAGNVLTLEDLVDIVGVDAARFALVRSTMDAQLDIDLDVLKRKTNDNPVYYVQYAHARTCAVARNAALIGMDPSEFMVGEALTHESESVLLGALQDFQRVTSEAAAFLEPHRIARYLENLASLYHRWYDKCRVVPNQDEAIAAVHKERLALNQATGQVLRNGLQLLGVGAPERM